MKCYGLANTKLHHTGLMLKKVSMRLAFLLYQLGQGQFNHKKKKIIIITKRNINIALEKVYFYSLQFPVGLQNGLLNYINKG